MPDRFDRSVLLGLVDGCVDAAISRAPERLPLTPGARLTENGREAGPGEGLWATLTAVMKRHAVADPATGQAALLAIVEDDDTLATFGLRLRAAPVGDNRLPRVAELETLVCREGEASVFGPTRMVTHRQAYFDRPLHPHDRTPRAEMLRLVDGYLQGIEDDTSDLTTFHPDCERHENGLRTTNQERIAEGAGIAEQLDSGFFTYVTRVRDRRPSLVDEDHGLVFASAVLDVPGGDAGGIAATLPERVRARRSVLVFELFRIEDHAIRDIDAVMVNLPYGAPSGWEA